MKRGGRVQEDKKKIRERTNAWYGSVEGHRGQYSIFQIKRKSP